MILLGARVWRYRPALMLLWIFRVGPVQWVYLIVDSRCPQSCLLQNHTGPQPGHVVERHFRNDIGTLETDWGRSWTPTVC